MSGAAATFSYRNARSAGLVLGLGMAIVVETIALHALFMRSHPVVAWLLTATSAWALWWIVADYRAMARGAIVVGSSVALHVGRRLRVEFPTSAIASVTQPTWRERPARAPDYINATRPAEPNVLITLREPVRARLVGGLHRQVSRIGIRVDDPAGLVASLQRTPM
ncbi:MAG TPA: hypothetical protein VJ867_16050 [Gemmatimonadaceae bacterium]|nr:hypothetical protein [Gemmatimonadaceae bacterium]